MKFVKNDVPSFDKQVVTGLNPMSSLQVGKILAFLIISPPLILNHYHKSLFYVTKTGAWGDGIMIAHNDFWRKITSNKPLSY
ncbi:MAG: hypothetical protein H8D23_09855 [Candidatus Brocadiales bacterium]|nr:hypothetical protein [Candidatus Brocadiales bacterium]